MNNQSDLVLLHVHVQMYVYDSSVRQILSDFKSISSDLIHFED